jgi:Na+-translocating ferredoxin:NAD+ oxidoreductase RnfC subunit
MNTKQVDVFDSSQQQNINDCSDCNDCNNRCFPQTTLTGNILIQLEKNIPAQEKKS